MRIPEVRERLRDLSAQLKHEHFFAWAEELRTLEQALYRRPYLRPKPKDGGWTMDELLTSYVNEIKHLNEQGVSNQEIAKLITKWSGRICNGGRISEVLRGKRK